MPRGFFATQGDGGFATIHVRHLAIHQDPSKVSLNRRVCRNVFPSAASATSQPRISSRSRPTPRLVSWSSTNRFACQSGWGSGVNASPTSSSLERDRNQGRH